MNQRNEIQFQHDDRVRITNRSGLVGEVFEVIKERAGYAGMNRCSLLTIRGHNQHIARDPEGWREYEIQRQFPEVRPGQVAVVIMDAMHLFWPGELEKSEAAKTF